MKLRSFTGVTLIGSALLAALLWASQSFNLRKPASDAPPVAVIEAPQSKFSLCKRYQDPQRHEFAESLFNSKNRLSFLNGGGLINGGVCWWHSRFTRAATYLAYYSPQKPKPTDLEAYRLIRKIAEQRSIVEIPGYKNLYDFSKDFQSLLQYTLEDWQIRNAVGGAMRTINPLRRSSHTEDPRQQNTIDDIDFLISTWGTIPYVMIQLPGITAHAWLVVKVEKTITQDLFGQPYVKEYLLHVVDSNNYDIKKTIYHPGENTMNTSREYGMKAAIYLDYFDDLDRIYKAVNTGCGNLFIPEMVPGQRGRVL